MVDPDTFLTTWSVMVDECCPSQLPPAIHPGPRASLSRREVVTLGLFGQWAGFRGERAFDRYAHQYLRTAFPTLPPRSPLKRLRRRHHAAIVACFLPLGDRLAGRQGPYEALDSSAVPTREAKRRGAGGLPGLADIGWSNRLGWYEGFHRRRAVRPRGVITAVGFGAASAQDQALAAPVLARRQQPHPRGWGVGQPALGPYGCDQGFEGPAAPARWWPS
jgi:hypothetical protein